MNSPKHALKKAACPWDKKSLNQDPKDTKPNTRRTNCSVPGIVDQAITGTAEPGAKGLTVTDTVLEHGKLSQRV